jgi:hypothetical protein
MSKLEAQIRDAIRAGRWSVSSHADDQCADRGVELWQIVEGFDLGTTLLIDTTARPNPKLLREQLLASGERGGRLGISTGVPRCEAGHGIL